MAKRKLSLVRPEKPATQEAMLVGDVGDLFGSSGEPTSTRHTHVLMRPAEDGRHWAFDSRQAREATRILAAYADWLDGDQREVEA